MDDQSKLKGKSYWHFVMVSLFALFSGCAAAQQVKILELEKVGEDFDVAAFYKPKLAQTAKTVATPPNQLDRKDALKKLDENFFAKDTLCFYTSAAFDGKYIDSKSDFSNRNKADKGIFGFTYNTIAWDDNDSLAVFNGVYFQTLDMLTQADGKLLALKATNTSKTENNSRKLIAFLTKKYGSPKTLKQDGANDIAISAWESATDKIQLRTTIDSTEEVSSIAADGKKQVKSEKSYKIDYFKIGKKQFKDLQTIKTGRWYLAE